MADAGPLIEGQDYTIDPISGLMILSAEYLLRRGTCCEKGCKNCPFARLPPASKH